MSKAIRVTIGGKELTLRGEHEELIRSSVREVNQQLQTLQESIPDQSTSMLQTLAGLNLAEQYLTSEERRAADAAALEVAVREIERMTAYLKQACS